MSNYPFLTERERKIQAAAICKEVCGSEEDLGKKVKVPKEIMLEELSLASNKGSRLFKMRQKRSEKYTFESIQNEANAQINNSVIPPVSALATDMKTDVSGLGADQSQKAASDTSKACTMPDPDCIASGYGRPLNNVPSERFNCTAIPKSYFSPWEQAIISDPSLADTLHVQMPEPESRPQIPAYKSFNRVATPFGGFGKVPKAPVKPVEEDLSSSIPTLPPPAHPADPVPTRPTFNRTALGWVSEGAPLVIPIVPLEPLSSMSTMFIPESDEL